MGIVNSGIIGMLVGAGIFARIIFVALYVLMALALQTIARREGHTRPWLAWIPFANIALIFQLGNFHWALVFLIIGSFIPFVGALFGIAILVLFIISHWRIYEKENYPGWLSILTVIPLAYYIIISIVAWNKR